MRRTILAHSFVVTARGMPILNAIGRQVAVLYLTQPRLFGLRIGTRFGSRVIGDVPGAVVGPLWATSDKPEDCGRGRPGAADSP